MHPVLVVEYHRVRRGEVDALTPSPSAHMFR